MSGREVDVSVVIVSWNTRDLLRDCLRSVVDESPSIAIEVFVVDNASADGSPEMVEQEFPQVRLIRNTENRGFAAANNQGLAEASGRYSLLLNPDTIILDRAIERSVEYADGHADVGVFGCQVMENDSTIQPTCFSYPGPLNLFLVQSGLARLFRRSRFFGRPELTWWGRSSELDVEVVSGMFMLVRREAIEQVGLMDEDYFVYAEEADWCCRIRRAGWKCRFAPIARIVHLDGGSKSTSQIRARMYVQMQKSLVIFNRKNFGRLAAGAVRAIFLAGMAARYAYWGTLGALRNAADARHRRSLITAACRFHLFGKEPA